MKKLGFILAFAMTLSFVSQEAHAVKVPLNCKKLIKKVQEKGRVTHEDYSMRSRKTTSNMFLKPVYAIRDGVRRAFQYFNGNPYPSYNRNNAPIALGWAQKISGRIADSHKDKVNVDKIDADLKKTLSEIESYNSKLESLIDEAANQEIEKHVLKAARKKQYRKNPRPIEVEIPYFKDGNLQPEYRVEYFGTLQQLKIEARKEVKRDIKAIEKEYKELVRQHVYNLEKIEVFVHTLRREKSEAMRELDLNEAQKDILARADALYVKGDGHDGKVGGLLKDEYIAPIEAWNAARWKAFFNEATTLFLRTKMNFENDPRVSSFWEYLKNLTPKEQRALGIKNFFEAGKLLRKIKWMRILTPLLGGGALGFVARDDKGQPYAIGLVNELLADWFKREECIQAKKEEDYRKCIKEYLMQKYPGDYLADKFDVDALVYNGEIDSDDINADIASIKKERREYMRELALENVLDLALEASLEDASDPNTSVFRRNLIKNPDEGLAIMIILSPNIGVGYLSTRHPYAYEVPELRALARIAVENRDNTKMLATTLARMTEYVGGKDMAIDLGQLLKAREEAKAYSGLETELDKLLDELIKEDRGIHDGERGGN